MGPSGAIRAPMFATSHPRVFAAGDARAALGEALGRQIGIYQEAVGEVA